MSETASTKPQPEEGAEDQPASKPPLKRLVAFVERLLRGQIRLPTFWLFLLAIIVQVPDWNSRYVFWLQKAKASGGYFGDVAAVLLWPHTSLVIAGLGIAALVAFETRDRKLARNGPSVAFAWISLVVCVVAIGSTALYGYVQLYIEREIAAGIVGLPRNAPSLADPNRPQRPLVTASRMLQPEQMRVLLELFPKLKQPSTIIWLMYDMSDIEAINVMGGYQKVLARSGLTPMTTNRLPSGPEDTGIRIVVPDLEHISSTAQALKRDLEIADVRISFEQLEPRPRQDLANVVGLYVAPAPIE